MVGLLVVELLLLPGCVLVVEPVVPGVMLL
jgi:hypothetical protein